MTTGQMACYRTGQLINSQHDLVQQLQDDGQHLIIGHRRIGNDLDRRLDFLVGHIVDVRDQA